MIFISGHFDIYLQCMLLYEWELLDISIICGSNRRIE